MLELQTPQPLGWLLKKSLHPTTLSFYQQSLFLSLWLPRSSSNQLVLGFNTKAGHHVTPDFTSIIDSCPYQCNESLFTTSDHGFLFNMMALVFFLLPLDFSILIIFFMFLLLPNLYFLFNNLLMIIIVILSFTLVILLLKTNNVSRNFFKPHYSRIILCSSKWVLFPISE